MPIKDSTNPHVRKYKVNPNFFKKWNSRMAYILGFAFADGNVYHTTFSWKLANNKSNKELLMKINRAMDSTYPIEKQTDGFRLRINHVLLVKDLIGLGVIPNKSKKGDFPKIPTLFFRRFVRGFLDGDGWITTNKKKKEISVGFSNGNYKFLKGLVSQLEKNLSLAKHKIRKKTKFTKNKKIAITYEIEYYSNNAYRIIKYLYDNLIENDLFLQRKYRKQIEARQIYEDLIRGTKLWRKIEDRYKLSMKKLLFNLYRKRGLKGIQIAKKLRVHSSSIYRWLAKTKIKFSVPKEKRIVVTKCLLCKKEIVRYRGRQVKYCSLSCRLKARYKGKFVKCVWCERKIYRPKWWFKVNNIPFCSRKCIGKWQGVRLQNNLLRRSKITGRFLFSKSLNYQWTALIKK